MGRFWGSWLLLLTLCGSVCWCQSDNANMSMDDVGSEKNVTLITDMLDLFNLRRTMKLWPEIKRENLLDNANCSSEMEEYFQGIEEQKIWSLKSSYFVL